MWTIFFGIFTDGSNLLVNNCSLDHIHISPSLLFLSLLFPRFQNLNGSSKSPLRTSAPFPVEWHFPLPCSAGWQSELPGQNVLWWVMQELLSHWSPQCCRAGGFLGRWPHEPCQQKSEPLIPPWNSSCLLSSLSLMLLPDVTQKFSHQFQPIISKQIPKKTTSTPNLPQVQCLAWNVLFPVALCPPQWLHPKFHCIPGKLHTFTPGRSLAQSRNSDILSL